MFSHDSADAEHSHDTAAVQGFIRRYDDAIQAADFAAMPSFFDPQVLVVTPTSSRCLSREEFVAAAEARARHMDSVPRAELVEQATTELGGHYWLTSVLWRLALDDRRLDLYSDFLVRRVEDELRIAAYLARQDLPRLIREAGEQA
ncbi:uncharacterized protein DUF4440 [Nocardia tenerifensis]|uniref:Uncharacterized protein DUF4440 n=1 Tax=Nocardia tenerifensis TaxID=228006 RepID=A0A318JUK9_9NOCA|nr:DUF4440 domain-containing protein [Nocardia tenerifensis]PXX59133.1 uncharacterized protein DUF4440 [Nocardia tenerifensis]